MILTHVRVSAIRALAAFIIVLAALISLGSSPFLASASTDSAPVKPTPIYRLYNGRYYFYTLSASERDSAMANYGYIYQGVAGYMFEQMRPRTVPVYRLRGSNGYLYTTSANERDAAVSKYGYIYEGYLGYIFDRQVPGTTPLYRLRSTNYLYTADPEERARALLSGYIDEGITGYVLR